MKLQGIIDNLTQAIVLVDQDLRIRYLNPAGEESLGTGIRHAIGRPLTSYIQDADGDFIAHIRRSIATGNPVTEREVCVRHPGAGEITINCAITPLPFGETMECLLEITRIDHLIRISREEHLLSENLATQNMLRGLAHEIKNPLGGLRGAAQLLAESWPMKICECIRMSSSVRQIACTNWSTVCSSPRSRLINRI